jgi:hypothetical protein
VIDRDAALHHLSTVAEPPAVDGIPAPDLARSPAAATVAALAHARRVPVAHDEHRCHRPLPSAWGGAGDDLPTWDDGVLAEPKYGRFRHDLLVASFHPGHRAKWSAHALCHALVGFAWAPGATPLFHATAARLAELVPTVLWYFLDEIGLRRCPRHIRPTFRTGCPACARAASAGRGPVDPDVALRWLDEGDHFLEDELAAVRRTVETGTPCAHVWGSLDLCSDGLAYAGAHGPRLQSREMASWAERFVSPGLGVTHTSLAALEERVVAVVRAVAEGRALEAVHGPWVAMDLAARVLEVHAETEGEVRAELVALVDRLAAGDRPRDVVAAYSELCSGVFLPSPGEVFAVGYPVEGLPTRSIAQVEDGLRSVVPVTLTAADDAGVDLVSRFVPADVAERAPLGVRFARWLTTEAPGAVADLARWEAALRSVRADGEPRILGAGSGLRLAEGVVVVTAGVDVDELAEAVERGDVTASARDAWPVLDVEPRPTTVLVGRDAAGDLVVAELPPTVAERVVADPGALPEELCDELVALGLLVPERWPI